MRSKSSGAAACRVAALVVLVASIAFIAPLTGPSTVGADSEGPDGDPTFEHDHSHADAPVPARSADAQRSSEVRSIVFPVEGKTTYSDSFGACRGTNCSRSHMGNDLMGTRLQNLLAAQDGVIRYTRNDGGGTSGNYLILQADDGWEYWYMHINNDTPGTDDGANPKRWIFAPGIERGVRVRAGQRIAYMGDSGNAEACNCPHLHFEIRKPTGAAIDPYPSLNAARRLVLGQTALPDPVVADVDGDGRAEVLLYGPGSAEDHRYDVIGGPHEFEARDLLVRGTYVPLVGDFDGNGYDDILWYAPGTARDYYWYHGPDGRRSVPTRIIGKYDPQVGDFDGNGYDDILWYAPGTAPDYYWYHRAGGYRDVRTRILGKYQPLVSDFDGNNYDDILWYAPGTARDYLWGHSATRTSDTRLTINGNYTPFTGDLDGNGQADVYWFSPGPAADYFWYYFPHGYKSIRSDNHTYDRGESGDLDGDGDEEIVWFTRYGVEPDRIWDWDGSKIVQTKATVKR